jgi:peptidoglycan hydrolase-like protein with peptidoglycan-binding domain
MPSTIRNRRRLWIAGAAVAATLAGAAAIVAARSGPSAAAPPPGSHGPTATITARDLVQTDDQPGTLGYQNSYSVYNQLGGTVTWLPQPGDVIAPDHRLLSLDGSPVALMNGGVPMYRSLSEGVADGPDVRELNADLVALGYDPYREITVDDDFGAGTADAVNRWEAAHGLTQDGQVALGRIVFLPGVQRIATVNASVGQSVPGGSASSGTGPSSGGQGASGAAVMTTTSDRHVVTVQLDASRQTEAVVGEHVYVTLPSTAVARGVITQVGRVAQTSSPAGTGSSSQGSGGNSTSGAGAAPQATIPVTISLRHAGRLGSLDQAPVTVAFALARTRNALSIPVSALLATAGGGYAVDVVQPNGTAVRTSVTPGSFAGGYVQISGSGIAAGMQVRDTSGS